MGSIALEVNGIALIERGEAKAIDFNLEASLKNPNEFFAFVPVEALASCAGRERPLLAVHHAGS
jgi:hypothetical protein